MLDTLDCVLLPFMILREESRVVMKGQVWLVPWELGLGVRLQHHLLVRHTAALCLVWFVLKPEQ